MFYHLFLLEIFIFFGRADLADLFNSLLEPGSALRTSSPRTNKLDALSRFFAVLCLRLIRLLWLGLGSVEPVSVSVFAVLLFGYRYDSGFVEDGLW